MRSFFLGFFLLVGLFVFSGGVDAAESCLNETIICCNKPLTDPSRTCKQQSTRCFDKKSECTDFLTSTITAFQGQGFPNCNSPSCVETTPSACASLPGGECISQGVVCPTGKQDAPSIDCGAGKKCCATTGGNECIALGGQCLSASSNPSCPEGKPEILADGCSATEKCCPKPSATPNACTTGGGVCVSGKTCPDNKAPLGFSCPTGATAQVCCPKPGGGGPGGTGGAKIEFQNPLKYDTVQEVVGALLAALQGIIVLLSIVFIVIGAVMYVTSAGNEGMVKLAKGAILASMIGLAIGIAAPTFLKEIYDILDASPEVTIPEEVESATPIRDILMNTLNFLLAIIGVLSMIMLVIGGIMYLLSGGDEKRIETGKKIVVFSLIGLTVALASLILVRQIANFFG